VDFTVRIYAFVDLLRYFPYIKHRVVKDKIKMTEGFFVRSDVSGLKSNRTLLTGIERHSDKIDHLRLRV